MEKKMNRYPCHIYEIPEGKDAIAALKVERVKDYGDCVHLDDGTVLHWNYTWDDGGRMLLRCRECGALLLLQSSEYHSFSDSPDGYYSDWIPAATEEEADLLNILLDVLELEDYPCRHLRSNNFSYFWTEGEDPQPQDPEDLKRQILEKYGLKDLSAVL